MQAAKASSGSRGSGIRKASSYPSSLTRFLEGRPLKDSEAVAGIYGQQDSWLNGRVPSQAMLSPFSPVFDLELEKRANSSSTIEKCCSEALLTDGDVVKPTLFQQILQLCRCTSPVATHLLQQLQRLRIAFAATPANVSSNSPPAVNGSSPTGTAASGFLATESSMDIGAMARELLASGYLVQVRDGAQQQERSKSARSCLQNLRHRFIVCLGWRSSGDAEPEYLPEPLVVEPRFREQFAIAHPTTEYEALLQAVPPCFVGTVSNLEAVVKLLCEQMVAAFKVQGLPVPPWRTRQALLSKWSPTQLAELAAKIANVRRLSIDTAALGGTHAHDRLRNGDRPAAVHTHHAAVGSAPPLAGSAAAGQQVWVFTEAAVQAGGPQQLTQEQLMAIVPPDMLQQLQQQDTVGSQAHAGYGRDPANTAVPMTVQQQHAAATVPVVNAAAYSSGCYAVHSSGVPPSAVARPLAPIQQGVPQLSGMPGPAAAPLVCGGATPDAAAANSPNGMSPAAADVMALLQAAEGLPGSVGGSTSLKFTRKASAEWKNHRTSGRKMKSLLAAALKKSVSGSSRSNLGATGCVAAGVGNVSDPLAARAGQHVGSTSSSTAAVATQACVVHETVNGGPDALIRRTHYRTTGDEPWRRITTVRWGAYSAQQAAAQKDKQPSPALTKR